MPIFLVDLFCSNMAIAMSASTGLVKTVTDGGGYAVLTQPLDQGNDHEGVPAQLEEVVVPANPFKVQELLPDLGY